MAWEKFFFLWNEMYFNWLKQDNYVYEENKEMFMNFIQKNNVVFTFWYVMVIM